MESNHRTAAPLHPIGFIALFSLLAALSACSISPLAKRTADFSTAATAAATQTENAYQLVNQVHADAQMATLVATYDRTPFDATKITPFLPADDIEVRTKVLDGLKEYATLLAEVSGNQPITDLETQVTAAGQALGQLQQDDFKDFKITSTEQNVAVTAVAAIGAVLIQHERSRALPGILDKMNDPIQKICAILESDIGTVGKPGLASALHRDYDSQIAAEQKFIADNAATLTPDRKRTEIETLPKLVLAQQQSDQALATTAKCLASLAAAHAALASTKTQKDAPAFKLELRNLVENAKSIDSFYSSLSAQK